MLLPLVPRFRHAPEHLLVVVSLLVLTITAPARAHAADDVVAWNDKILSVLALSGQNNVVQTRSLAMAHAAIHDALNAIDHRYRRYAFRGHTVHWASAEGAVAAAAYGVLAGVIPDFGTAAQQTAALEAATERLTASLSAIPDGPAKTEGMFVGQVAAAAILALRDGDGATSNIPYTPLTGPGYWQPTPNPNPPDPAIGGPGFQDALLPGWGNLTPFTLRSGEQFRPDGPPALTSRRYARDYEEVMILGERLSVVRTAEQSEIARFWYEGSQAGWNRIARVVASHHVLDLWEQARLFALLNFAMADGFIAGWDTRYFYNFWRPVTAIREGDNDGNDRTIGDPLWESFLNTPAIPDYPSTHSVLGAAAARVLARFFEHDEIAFVVTSGAPFAGITRAFSSFSEAARENADSRVYAGIHFRTACRDGLRLGRSIGAWVVNNYLEPLDGRWR